MNSRPRRRRAAPPELDLDEVVAAEILNVGLNVKTARVLNDLTQDDLARKSGVSREFINRLERGADEVNPSVGHLTQIAHVLKIELKYFFEKPKKRLLFFARMIEE